ncbi:hypothetical protein KSP39_PZI016606 [Platanthera zijinensis]|uniref:Uncharacterized protein n=1 Tax=Platanthera zijinensis TaxID=2320716 RepID=A0AAP0B7D7_9ASPA
MLSYPYSRLAKKPSLPPVSFPHQISATTPIVALPPLAAPLPLSRLPDLPIPPPPLFLHRLRCAPASLCPLQLPGDVAEICRRRKAARAHRRTPLPPILECARPPLRELLQIEFNENHSHYLCGTEHQKHIVAAVMKLHAPMPQRLRLALSAAMKLQPKQPNASLLYHCASVQHSPPSIFLSGNPGRTGTNKKS